jgi:hypothetical protein
MIRLPGQLPASADQRLLDQLAAVAQAMTEPPVTVTQARTAPKVKRARATPKAVQATPKAVRHLTPAELSDRLGGDFPVETLKRWRRTGDGPRFLRVGRHIRYRLTDVEAWEKTRLVTTA